MKKTLFMSLLAAVLMGGQGFAATSIDGITSSDTGEGWVAGAYSQTEDVTGGNVTIREDSAGADESSTTVYGGYARGDEETNNSANGNKVTMTGGLVTDVYGGFSSFGNANNNTIVFTGGEARDSVLGGYSHADGEHINQYEASNNTVIITGGTINAGVAGAITGYSQANNNSVHIVGNGATASIGGETYDGQAGITLGAVYAGCAGDARSDGNSIDIYGNGITAGSVSYMQILNFHIVNEDATALTLTSRGVDLSGIELSFGTLDASIEFETITLINVTATSSSRVITLNEDQLSKTWDITDADGNVAYTAKLSLENNDKTLKLGSFTKVAPTPEPATASLSLLALAGLAARRRRK